MDICNNCSGDLTQTSENLTCFNCGRVDSSVFFGTPGSQINSNAYFYTPPSNNEGVKNAEQFCQKHFLADIILQQIIEYEKTKILLTKKNSKLSFCLSAIAILSQNNIYVDVAGVTKYFDIYSTSVTNSKFFIQPNNTDTCIKNYLECHMLSLSLTYQNTTAIMTMYLQCRKILSSGVDKIVILGVTVVKFLVQHRNLKIHRASSIVCEYFGVGRSTLLKHYKSIK